MPKKHRPTTPSRRYIVTSSFEEITKSQPEKSLLVPCKKSGGRNSQGRITVRHRGGGHKRRIRIIDFKRDKDNTAGKVAAIEYDPNRSARLALIGYADGEKRYIICPLGLKVGDTVSSGESIEPKIGNNLPLKDIFSGTPIHNIELVRGRGGQIVRSAGSSAMIMAKEDRYAHVKLPSGEIRLIPLDCRASIGQIGNVEHETAVSGKAGRSRWLGFRPTVRGVAMNPVDHPLGGGEGKSAGGRIPVTPWGKVTKGLKTRKKKRLSNKFIVKRRK